MSTQANYVTGALVTKKIARKISNKEGSESAIVLLFSEVLKIV